ncbi:MAG: class I SAM-dependent methyltransferase [Solirubrobacterales bacterium]
MINYERLYAYRFQGVDRGEKAAVWAVISAYIYEQLGRPARVLDPAAGSCEFINSVPARERWGIDRVPFDGVEVAPGTKLIVSDVMTADLPAEYFDGALVSNFLEHLPSPDAVADFLDRLRGWIRPGGRVAIMGPNYRYCSDDYWDFADHELALTHVAIQEHLYAAGFDLVRSDPRFLPVSFRGILPPSPRLTRLYLRTPLAWRLFGKQFLVIASR